MEPVDKRQIGPVTTAAGVGVAAAGFIAWLLEEFAHIDMPPAVQGYLGLILVVTAGYLVKPKAKRAAE